jgi:hypothetical protein
MDKAEIQPARTLPSGVWRLPAVWIFAVVLLAALLFVVVLATQERVPSHAGRSAEAWLRDIFGPQRLAAANPRHSQREAIDAFRHMGTNGISFLVETLGREDTFWNRLALKLHPKLPAALRQRLPEPIRADTLKNAASLVLLNASNPHPEAAFSRMVELLESSNPLTQGHAWGVVSQYPLRYPTLDLEPYAPQFRRALGDTNYWTRVYAVNTLQHAGLAGPEMIPALSPALTSGDPTLSNAVQNVIRRLEKLPPREP